MTETQTPTVQTRTHHKFGPSRMNHLAECAAFCSSGESSEAADRGTLLHDIMEQCIKGVEEKHYSSTLQALDPILGATQKAEQTEIEPDERGYLIFCCKKVDAFLAKNPTKILTEILVSVHNGTREINHGYLDMLLIFGTVAILIDYKFGWLAVKPAKDNIQGKNYVAGVFQRFPDIKKIGVCFIQPKLGVISEHVFTRDDMPGILKQLDTIVHNAIFVQERPDKAPELMKPGTYCGYCQLAGTCAVLANHRAAAAATFTNLPLPVPVAGMALAKPEQFAMARYWVDIIETRLSEVKKACFEAAKANGGTISCTLPDGRELVYEVQSRGCDRVLSSAVEVAEALKDLVTTEEILGAAELSVGKLEKICRDAVPPVLSARTGEKVTKKAAWEMVASTLSAQNLLSQPDTRIEFLKQKQQVN